MEDNGYKYTHKLTQFVATLNSRRNCSIDLIPKNVNNSDFLSILYSKPIRQLKNPSSNLETEFPSLSMTYPSGRVIRHSLHIKFSKLLKFLPKNLQHTKKVEQDEIMGREFYQKVLINYSFNNGIVYKRVSFKCICATFSRQYTELFYKLSTRQLNLEGQCEVAISKLSYPSM